MKKFRITFNRIFFASFILIWFAVAVVNLLIPRRDFSENENRFLADFPKYSLKAVLNGKFMNAFEDYVNDHFLCRDSWISAQSILEYLTGKRESNGVFICKNALISKLSGPNEAYVSANIEGINSFVSATNLPTALMIVPSASEIEAYKLPAFAETWSQKDEIGKIYSLAGSAKCVSVDELLSAHKYEQIYYRTDHHWTTYGAYLAYSEYCAQEGLTPAPYAASAVSDAFNGTLYSSSGVRFIESDVIEAFDAPAAAVCEIFDGEKTAVRDGVYFPEYLDKKDKYAYFLGTNQPIITITGGSPGGQKLLLIKDSYAHCMAPMLLSNYSEITLVDMRYLNGRLDNFLDPGDYDRAFILQGIDSFVNQNNLYKLTLLSGEGK